MLFNYIMLFMSVCNLENLVKSIFHLVSHSFHLILFHNNESRMKRKKEELICNRFIIEEGWKVYTDDSRTAGIKQVSITAGDGQYLLAALLAFCAHLYHYTNEPESSSCINMNLKTYLDGNSNKLESDLIIWEIRRTLFCLSEVIAG